LILEYRTDEIGTRERLDSLRIYFSGDTPECAHFWREAAPAKLLQH